MKKTLLAGTAILGFFFHMQAGELKVQNLTCEYLHDPLGIDLPTPRLSWEIEGDGKDIRQTAYRILVASAPEILSANKGDLWDSREVSSDRSLNIDYGGKILASRASCYWKVMVITNKGKSPWSAPAKWSMGLLNKTDWKAHWIGCDKAFPGEHPDSVFSRLAARYFRKEFNIQKKVTKATAYICGLGLYELHINGKKIGDQVLSPALSDYAKRTYYNTFDVTSAVVSGKNAFGIILGNGRFVSMRPGAPGIWKEGIPSMANYGFPKLLFQLELELEDGSQMIISSDNTWKYTASGPIRANNEFDGEEYDARKEFPGWDRPSFSAPGWLQTEEVKPPCDNIVAQMNPNIKIMESVRPKSIKQIDPGTFIVDMGQNMVGWVHLRVKGMRGQSVKLRFAERINENGTLYLANIRSAKVTDVYTMKGGEQESWEPTFVYHGFRFVEITGYPGKPDLSAIEGKVIYDEMPATGSFETSNVMINNIYSAASWTIKGNYRSIPTDCPQRDERMGWLGDRSINSYGESFLFGNSRLYAKWVTDIADAQKPGGSVPDVVPAYWAFYNDNMTWPSTFILIPGMLYQQFGDEKPIIQHYGAMKKWLLYMRDNYLKDNLINKDNYGDWCMPPERIELIHSLDPKRKTPGEYLASAYYYYCLNLMGHYAEIVNQPGDAQEFRKLSGDVRKAINLKFLHTDSLYYANNTVTANAMALFFGIAPEALQADIFSNLVKKTIEDYKGHISTGLVGGQWIMRTLDKWGRPDIAVKMVTNRDYPGWGYMIENGATTIWELWNGNTADPAMNSGNHVMLLGDLLIWFYENLAGIKSSPDHPGFKEIIMNPTIPDSLHYVKAFHQSPYGLIKSEWTKEDRTLKWNITIPANTSATVYIPANTPDEIQEGSGKAIQSTFMTFERMEKNKAVFKVQSGSYAFIVPR
jgi:alpha-L-rhamnosidase